jgi:hypothetical protein
MPAEIVRDMLNGKRLGPDHPFCVVAKNDYGDLILVKKLAYIRVTR